MVIKVCIGSACHLKGSYDVIEMLRELIQKHKVEEQVELKASFCLGTCTSAVSVQVDDEEIISLLPNTVEAFFEDIVKDIRGEL